jgi:HEAT repeat protein
MMTGTGPRQGEADRSNCGTSLPSSEPVTPRGPSFVFPGFLIIVGFIILLFATSRPARAALFEAFHFYSLEGQPVRSSAAVLSEHEIEVLDKMPPQAQAELLLERSINHFKGANEQIAARVLDWTGHIKTDDGRLRDLFMTALNSDDLRVRVAAIEVNIAARNLQKGRPSFDLLENDARNGEQGPRANALWNLALLGNRGVEPTRALDILLGSLHDPNENIRYWAVEGLAYLGTDETIAPLLQAFHDDPSHMIRERAACGLAQSGMLSETQRRKAVPRLLEFADDSSLDAETQTWVYQALRDITGQTLPHNAAAWRNWYASNADGRWKPVTRDAE